MPKFLLRAIVYAVGFFLLIAALTVVAAHAVTATPGVTDSFGGTGLNLRLWCPAHITHTPAQCFRVQPDQPKSNVTVCFDPADSMVVNGQLREFLVHAPCQAGGIIYPYRSGGINGGTKQDDGFGTSAARLRIPCKAGLVADWPAFWLTGTVGPWPAHGEIDVLEGLRGHLAWHIHFLAADGRAASVGGRVPGNWCGWHTFAVWRGPGHVTFRYDGTVVGRVRVGAGGIPLATDPMFPIISLNASLPGFCCGGPFDPAAQLRAAWFAFTPAGVG